MKDTNDILKRMINVLIINGPFTPRLGLLDGKMGIAILFYHYGRYTAQKKYEDFAGDLLDYIFEEINLQMSATFGSGLAGIGWGIEYLVQNGFVEADTNEVLEEIDTVVFQTDRKKPMLKRHYDDCYGYGLYYLARTKNGNKPENFEEMRQTVAKDILDLLECSEENDDKMSTNYIKSLNFVTKELYQQKLIPHPTQIQSLNKPKIGDSSVLSVASQNAWSNLIFHQEKIGGKRQMLFDDVISFLKEKANWENLTNEISLNNLGLDNGWSGWCLSLLNC